MLRHYSPGIDWDFQTCGSDTIDYFTRRMCWKKSLLSSDTMLVSGCTTKDINIKVSMKCMVYSLLIRLHICWTKICTHWLLCEDHLGYSRKLPLLLISKQMLKPQMQPSQPRRTVISQEKKEEEKAHEYDNTVSNEN